MQKSGHCCLPHWGVGRATSRNCTESFKNYRVCGGGVGGGAEVEDGLVGSFRMERLKCIFIAFFKALLYVNIKNCFIIELTGASVLHSCTVVSTYTYV